MTAIYYLLMPRRVPTYKKVVGILYEKYAECNFFPDFKVGTYYTLNEYHYS